MRGWHGDGWGQCYGIAVFRPLKFETLCSVSGISKARGSGTGAGPRATVATRVPDVHYYRGFSLLQVDPSFFFLPFCGID